MKKLKRKIMAVPFGVMTSMMLMTSAFAAEPTEEQNKQIVETVETSNFGELTANKIQLQLESNNDLERRKALEETYKVQLAEDDIWEDQQGYTSHKTLKTMGNYAVNASRQELIKYGSRTGDWQPYRAFEAQKAPAYFELVDGKYEYSKIYWGNTIEKELLDFRLQLMKNWNEQEKRAEIEADMKAYIQKYAVVFNDAPGVVPYVIGLNNTESVAKENGVSEATKDYFNSKYNHPDVKEKGIFKDGSNPFKK